VRSARAASYPNLFVTGVHARLDQGPGNSVRTGVIFPLWDRGRLRAMRAEARAAVGAGEADLAEALRRVDLELQVAYNQALQAEVRLQRYRSGQLEQARTLADLAQFGYENGHTSYLELLDAQRVFNETRAGYIRALADAARARLALERAAGSPSLLPVAPQEAPAR
jgi:cobalt-zinc-cadmium efflux system outer membrane protein